MNQDTKNKMDAIIAAAQSKTVIEPKMVITTQQLPELSSVTISDLLKDQVIKEETVKILADEISEAKAGDLELVKYSDKSLALFGNTKPIKEQLKEMNGRYNPFLNYKGEKRAGWIFSKNRTQQLQELIK